MVSTQSLTVVIEWLLPSHSPWLYNGYYSTSWLQQLWVECLTTKYHRNKQTNNIHCWGISQLLKCSASKKTSPPRDDWQLWCHLALRNCGGCVGRIWMAQLELEQLFHNCSVVTLGTFGTSDFRGHYLGPSSNQGEYTRALCQEQSLADPTQPK